MSGPRTGDRDLRREVHAEVMAAIEAKAGTVLAPVVVVDAAVDAAVARIALAAPQPGITREAVIEAVRAEQSASTVTGPLVTGRSLADRLGLTDAPRTP